MPNWDVFGLETFQDDLHLSFVVWCSVMGFSQSFLIDLFYLIMHKNERGEGFGYLGRRSVALSGAKHWPSLCPAPGSE